MIDKQILMMRFLISRAAGIAPDDVEVIMGSSDIKHVLFEIEYNGFILVLGGLDETVSIDEVQEEIEYLYEQVQTWSESDCDDGDGDDDII